MSAVANFGRRQVGIALMLCAIFFAAVPSFAITEEATQLWADEYFSNALASNQVVGAAFTVVSPQQIIISKSFGKSNAETGEVIGESSTLLPMGNISSLFLAQEAIRLSQEELLSLDENPNNFLTRLRIPGANALTIRQLIVEDGLFDFGARNTLTDYSDPNTSSSTYLRRHFNIVPRTPPASFSDRTSATQIAVLSILLEDVSGISTQTLLKDTAEDFGLTAYMHDGKTEMPGNLLQPHRFDEGVASLEPLLLSAPGFAAVNGLYLTLSDVSKLAQIILGLNVEGENSNPSLQDLSLLGFDNYQIPRGNGLPNLNVFTLNGDVQGMTSTLVILPDEQIAVFCTVTGADGRKPLNFIKGSALIDRPITALDAAHTFVAQAFDPASIAQAFVTEHDVGHFSGTYVYFSPQDIKSDFPNNVLHVQRVQASPPQGLVINTEGPYRPITPTLFADSSFGQIVHFGQVSPTQPYSTPTTIAAMVRLADNVTMTRLDNPRSIYLAFAVLVMLATAPALLLLTPRWIGRASVENHAKWIGVIGSLSMLTTLILPILSYGFGWPSPYLPHPAMSMWATMANVAAMLAFVTLAYALVAVVKRFWAMDGKGRKRRSLYLTGALSLCAWAIIFYKLDLLIL